MNGSLQEDKSYVKRKKDREKPYLEEKGLVFFSSSFFFWDENPSENERQDKEMEPERVASMKARGKQKKKRITKRKCLCGSLSSNMPFYVI